MYGAATTGLIEGMIGQAYDGLADKSSSFVTDKLLGRCKGGMAKMLQSKGVVYASNVLQQAFGEQLEDIVEMPLDKVGRSMFLHEELAVAGDDWREAWNNSKLSFVSSLFTSMFFGLSADTSSKVYTESELLMDRIASGQVTPDELMAYHLDLYEATVQQSGDVGHVLEMTTPNGQVEAVEERASFRQAGKHLLTSR